MRPNVKVSMRKMVHSNCCRVREVVLSIYTEAHLRDDLRQTDDSQRLLARVQVASVDHNCQRLPLLRGKCPDPRRRAVSERFSGLQMRFQCLSDPYKTCADKVVVKLEPYSVISFFQPRV